MFSRLWLMCVAFLWTVAIVVGSFLPSQVKQTIGTESHSPHRAEQHLADVKHYIGHLIVFGIEAFLWTAASTRKTYRFYCFLFAVLLGLAIEYMQHVVNGFDLEWWDVVADTLAAAIGCVLGSLFMVRSYADQPDSIKKQVSLQ